MKLSKLILLFIVCTNIFGATLEEAKNALASKNYVSALNIYTELANNGDKVAQYNLGVMYYRGLGVEKDYSKAFEYTKQSAEQYYPDAQYNLAIYYLKGEGTTINPRRAYDNLISSSNVKESKLFLNKLYNIQKQANLKNHFCDARCILTYQAIGIKVSNSSIEEWKKKGIDDKSILRFLEYDIRDPNEMAKWIEKTGGIWEAQEYLKKGYTNPNNAIMTKYAKIGGYIAVFILIIIGIILGSRENRKIVVFKNYDDLGLTFLIPTSYALVLLVCPTGLSALNVNHENVGPITDIIGMIVSSLIFLKVLIVTFKANNSIPKTLLALLVKIPLSFLWVFALIELIKPSGETQPQKRDSRQTALLIFTLLTPIISALVVDKNGFFSPKAMLKGKRIGSRNRDLL